MNNHQPLVVSHRSTTGTLIYQYRDFKEKKKKRNRESKNSNINKKRLARHKKILPSDS